MDAKDALRAVRKHWVTVVAAILIGMAVAVSLVIVAKPKYASSVTFFVSTPTTDDASALAADQFVTRRVNSYVRLASSDRLADLVRSDAKIDLSTAGLASEISATADLNTVVLTVRVLDTNPARSLAIARSVATQFPTLINTVDRAGTAAQQVKLTAVSGPRLNPAPVRPSRALTLILGFLAGLVIGCAIAIVRELFDTSVRSGDMLREITGHALLGSVGYDAAAEVEPLLIGRQARSVRAEAFRQLRTNLQFVTVDKPVTTILVTSSVAGEGKSTTCANLAIVFAEAGRSTLLIEADMRRPRVTEYLGLERSVGLSNVLAGQVDVLDVLQPWGDGGLTVLAGGTVPPDPSALLGSQAMSDVIANLRDRFDVIIIDTPPLLPVTDAAVTSVHADGVVVVVRFGSTTRGQVASSMRSLEAVDARIFGSVLNMTRGSSAGAYDGYGYYEDLSDAAAEPQVARIGDEDDDGDPSVTEVGLAGGPGDAPETPTSRQAQAARAHARGRNATPARVRRPARRGAGR